MKSDILVTAKLKPRIKGYEYILQYSFGLASVFYVNAARKVKSAFFFRRKSAFPNKKHKQIFRKRNLVTFSSMHLSWYLGSPSGTDDDVGYALSDDDSCGSAVRSWKHIGAHRLNTESLYFGSRWTLPCDVCPLLQRDTVADLHQRQRLPCR